jgi:hypothetical protein
VGDVNRAKLYYLRDKVGRKARVRELRQDVARAPRGAQAELEPEVAESDVSDEPVEETAE